MTKENLMNARINVIKAMKAYAHMPGSLSIVTELIDKEMTRQERHAEAIELIYEVIDSGVNAGRVAKLAKAIDLIRGDK